MQRFSTRFLLLEKWTLRKISRGGSKAINQMLQKGKKFLLH
jgi:hypothetical protein